MAEGHGSRKQPGGIRLLPGAKAKGPSRQVSPDCINYTLRTADGKVVTGFIVAETAASVTLRRASEADDTVLRSQIKALRAEGKSLMPEGLEQGLAMQEMADLLAFVQKPEGRLLPEVK